MLTAQVEPFPQFLAEVKPLLKSHWEELALNKDKVSLDPQYEEYVKRDLAGTVLVVTLRKDGELVGYFVGFIAPGLHYKTCLTYTMDLFYISPSARSVVGGAIYARTMIKVLEQELRRRGVKRMFMGTKCHKDAGFLFEKLGYEKVEIYYSKWLGD